MEIKNIINTLFYILTFVITFNYIQKWNTNMKIISNNETINNTNNNINETFNNTKSKLEQLKQKTGYIKKGDYMCDSNIDGTQVGYANELETNEYQHMDNEVQLRTNGYKYEQSMTPEEKNAYTDFMKTIKTLEETYKGEDNKTELLYHKNKAYREYMNTRKQYTKSYLQSPNIDPKNEPIELTDRFPRRREELMDEQRRRHYHKLNTDWKEMGEDEELFLEKYDWLNKMGKPLKLPPSFNLLTDNDDILEYRKAASGRMPQDILTDYNPIIMGSQRLTRETVSRNYKLDENGNTPDEYFLNPYTEEEYNKYLDEISNKDYTKKYYEVLGMD
jgi:hypothetical protein